LDEITDTLQRGLFPWNNGEALQKNVLFDFHRESVNDLFCLAIERKQPPQQGVGQRNLVRKKQITINSSLRDDIYTAVL